MTDITGTDLMTAAGTDRISRIQLLFVAAQAPRNPSRDASASPAATRSIVTPQERQNRGWARRSSSALQVKTGEGSTKDLPKVMAPSCQRASQSRTATVFFPMRFSPVFGFIR